jgi:hypothetical protein
MEIRLYRSLLDSARPDSKEMFQCAFRMNTFGSFSRVLIWTDLFGTMFLPFVDVIYGIPILRKGQNLFFSRTINFFLVPNPTPAVSTRVVTGRHHFSPRLIPTLQTSARAVFGLILVHLGRPQV